MKRGKAVASLVLRASLCLTSCIAMLAVWTAPLHAKPPGSGFTLEGALGSGVVPMGEWQEFWDDFVSYREQNVAEFYELTLRYHFGGKHAVALSYERLSTEASAAIVSYSAIPEDSLGVAYAELEWQFEATPISVSYEFYPRGSCPDVSPFLGLGASYYFYSNVRSSYVELENRVMPEQSYENSRGGRGYGIHAYVGCRARLAQRIYLVARARVRYADSMVFTDEDDDVAIQLSGVDAILGLGYEF